VLLLLISACSCKQEAILQDPILQDPILQDPILREPKSSVAIIDMKVPQTQLVGPATEIATIFSIKGAAEKEVNIEDFKLRVRLGDQRAFTGPASGSQISYKDAKGDHKTSSTIIETLLTEFTNLGPGNPKNPSEFEVHFHLAPAPEVIQLKLHFELLHKTGGTTKTIEVEWIKGEIVVSPLSEFKKAKAFFTLKSLKADIKDTHEITVSILDDHKQIFLLVGENKKNQATLAELFPHIGSIPKDQETSPINVIIDAPQANNEPSVFSILVLATNKTSINEEKVTVHKPDLSKELENLANEMKNLEQKEELSKEELATLKNPPKVLEKAAGTTINTLKVEKRKIKEKEKGALKELQKEEKKALKGKTEDEQRAIKEEYKRKREEISAATKLKLEYSNGLKNAIQHDLLGVPLEQGETEQFRQGQQAGHRISLVIGRIEATMGPPLIAASLGVTLATLGLVIPITLPIFIVGGLSLAHGARTVERAENNLNVLKNK
jgi:hypothetical protein